jgi:hypothetical protein
MEKLVCDAFIAIVQFVIAPLALEWFKAKRMMKQQRRRSR